MSFTGWLTPSGQIVECDMWTHLDVIAQQPALLALVPDFAEWKADADNTKQACEALEKRGEHGEWHNYEYANDNARWNIWRTLLREGCLRFCQVGDRLHFEGTGQALAKQRQKCKDMAEERNLTAEFERR